MRLAIYATRLMRSLLSLSTAWHRQTAKHWLLATSLPTAHSLSTVATSAVESLLKNPSLLKWETKSQNFFKVFDPAISDSLLAEIPTMEANSAIQESYASLPSWRDDTTASFRASLLNDWSLLIKENSDDLATIMTLESGKPLHESFGEVNYARSFLDYYAAEAIRSTGAGGGFLVPSSFSMQSGAPRGQIMAVQQAIGVTALITPWNFPMAMITRKVGPALAAGCTALLKPSELTPLSAIALKNLADRAGIPPNVFQVITASSETTPEVGIEFCTNPLIQKVSFTGSTRVGKLLMSQCSDTVKRLSLELGGNAPFVVFEDADVDQAVDAAMASKFRNAGQTCVCADRFLVHESVHEDFVRKLVSKIKDIKVGPGISSDTNMGPLISEPAAKKVAEKVKQAIDEGAHCEVGGTLLPELGGQFYSPTVLTNVSRDSVVWKTENFSPVVPIMQYSTEEEALELANDSPVGLASYFCTKDLSRAFRFSKSLECGMVGINEGIISTCTAPFGGVKESGLGREGSSMGLAEYLETKYIFMNT